MIEYCCYCGTRVQTETCHVCGISGNHRIDLNQAQQAFMALYLAALDFGANRLKAKAYENILWPAIRKATQSTLYNEDVIFDQTKSTKSEVE